jgi:hypothetical protein
MIIDTLLTWLTSFLNTVISLFPDQIQYTFSSGFIKIMGYGMYFLGKSFFAGIFTALVSELLAFFAFWIVEYIYRLIRG